MSPSTLASAFALVTAVAVASRTIQEPGLDAATTIEAGPPLALIALGAIALAGRVAMRAEQEGTAWAGREAESELAGEAGSRPAD